MIAGPRVERTFRISITVAVDLLRRTLQAVDHPRPAFDSLMTLSAASEMGSTTCLLSPVQGRRRGVDRLRWSFARVQIRIDNDRRGSGAREAPATVVTGTVTVVLPLAVLYVILLITGFGGWL